MGYEVDLVFFLISLAVFAILYVVARFTYRIEDGALHMRWRILWFVPFGSRTIRLDNIKEARRFDVRRDIFPGAYVFGNLFVRKGIVLVLRRRIWLMQKVLITPPEPERFLELLRGRESI